MSASTTSSRLVYFELTDCLNSNRYWPTIFSQEFSSFTKINRIKLIKIFPHHPASNEAMERLVQTFEKLMTTKFQKGVSVSQQSYEFLIGPLCI